MDNLKGNRLMKRIYGHISDNIRYTGEAHTLYSYLRIYTDITIHKLYSELDQATYERVVLDMIAYEKDKPILIEIPYKKGKVKVDFESVINLLYEKLRITLEKPHQERVVRYLHKAYGLITLTDTLESYNAENYTEAILKTYVKAYNKRNKKIWKKVVKPLAKGNQQEQEVYEFIEFYKERIQNAKQRLLFQHFLNDHQIQTLVTNPNTRVVWDEIHRLDLFRLDDIRILEIQSDINKKYANNSAIERLDYLIDLITIEKGG